MVVGEDEAEVALGGGLLAVGDEDLPHPAVEPFAEA